MVGIQSCRVIEYSPDLSNGVLFGIILLRSTLFQLMKAAQRHVPSTELNAIEVCVDKSVLWKQIEVDYTFQISPNTFLDNRSCFAIGSASSLDPAVDFVH